MSKVKGGISAFKAPRPRVVLVSSAAVERNARIGDDEAARKRDIPIVQLNPGGILNYKYEGEQALRASGLPYTVIRPVGVYLMRMDCMRGCKGGWRGFLWPGQVQG